LSSHWGKIQPCHRKLNMSQEA